MAFNRDKAYEVSNDGMILSDGIHISSGSAIPTHTGKAGDRYFRTTTAGMWKLDADGTNWKLAAAEDASTEGTNNVFNSPGTNINSNNFEVFAIGNLSGLGGGASFIVISQAPTSGSVTIRLWNQTNATELASITNSVSTGPSRQTVGFTMPASPVVIEVQGKRANGTGILFAAEIR